MPAQPAKVGYDSPRGQIIVTVEMPSVHANQEAVNAIAKHLKKALANLPQEVVQLIMQ